jgi:hypothetical protein
MTQLASDDVAPAAHIDGDEVVEGLPIHDGHFHTRLES